MTAPTPTETARTGAEINSGALSPTPEGERTGEPDNSSHSHPNAEAAKYRVRAREAEQQRDALTAQLVQLQTAELHRQAGEHLAVPGDIELSGKGLADYLTPEGWIDREAVAQAAAALIESRPGLAKNPKVLATDPTQGSGGLMPAKATPTFGDLLKT
jgi:hypothetical protein